MSQNMMNTKICYWYTDAHNYKQDNECVVKGVLTEEQKAIILDCLHEGEYFVPRQLGMPEKRFDKVTDADHCWFTLEEDGLQPTNEEATLTISAEELVAAFQEAKGKWDELAWMNEFTEEEMDAWIGGELEEEFSVDYAEKRVENTMSVEALAGEIDRFSEEYDPYEYADQVSGKEEHVSQLRDDIASGNVKDIKKWLTDIIEEDEIPENVEKAKELLGQLEAFGETPEKASLDAKILGAQDRKAMTDGKDMVPPYVVLQKDDMRFTFFYEKKFERYDVKRENILQTGAEVHYEKMSVENGLKEIEKLKQKGFSLETKARDTDREM